MTGLAEMQMEVSLLEMRMQLMILSTTSAVHLTSAKPRIMMMTICGGGGGSFLACEDFGKMFDSSFPARALIFIYIYF